MIRRVLVLFDPELPIQKNFNLDISLLRAANQALMRQQNGIIDYFLFVICGNSNEQDVAKFFVPYNFSDVQVITVHTKDEDQNAQKNIFDEGELRADSVIKNFLITAADGKNYRTKLYNLDLIISVGYRIKSHLPWMMTVSNRPAAAIISTSCWPVSWTSALLKRCSVAQDVVYLCHQH